eukprot:symbB.v1.2.004542.t2/scaffold256.1/size249868/13
MRSEELLEIVKGLRTYSSSAGSVPDPCLYFSTDPTTREVELELPKWREGKYLVVKFLDSHNSQRNIDVGIVGLIGYTGRFAKQQIPLGPWMRRTAFQPWVHPNELKSMFSSSGWVCDGRDFTGGCRSGRRLKGLGPQTLWTTPGALVVPPVGQLLPWQEVLLHHLQQTAVEGCWVFQQNNLLDLWDSHAGPVAEAVQLFRVHVEEATRRYLNMSLDHLGTGVPSALKRIHVSIPSSWARSGCPDDERLPHVHPRVAFAGSLYLDCIDCGVHLQDPRTPAGMAEVPDALRRRLGWGLVHELRVTAGTLLLYPAWLYHAPLRSGRTLANASVISFLVAVQLQEVIGQTDFHQTNVYTVTFRCTTSGFDLCEKCAHDPDLGRVSEKSMRSDLEALLDPALCKLAVSRLRNLWRRNWMESLAKYFKAGLLDNLVQALQKCTENQRPEDERVRSSF